MIPSAQLTPRATLFALITVVTWGLNFIAVFIGLEVLPPLLFLALRFFFAAVPFVFFMPRPKAKFLDLVLFGLFNFVLQFGFMFSGLALGLSPGLASLVVQVQVFISMGLAFLFFGEKSSLLKVIGSVISFAGIVLVAFYVEGNATIWGFVFTLLAALSWALGNIFTKKISTDHPLSLVVWGNLIALPFMTVASFVIEGPDKIALAFSQISWETVGALVYTVYFSTHVAYGLWAYLLKNFATSAVVPYTLLIPVVGFLSSALFLGEELFLWKLWASILIMSGLVFNLLEKKIKNLFFK